MEEKKPFENENEELKFDEIPHIESFVCVFGLDFPESATEFQKAALTLAHLMAAVRNYVLKGVDVPLHLVELCDQLNLIMLDNEYKQR